MIKVFNNQSLKEHNTFGLDAKAAALVSYDSEDDIPQVLDRLRELPKPVLHIGRGSNLLFTKDFPGTILHSEIEYIHEESTSGDSVLIRVGSGVVWDDFCREMASRELYGTENLSYIPGEVGAAAVQNIGAYGAEVSQVVESVDTVEIATGAKRIFENSECAYGYRDSIFKNSLSGQYIVVSVLFRLSKVPNVDLEYGALKDLKALGRIPSAMEVRQKVIEIRRSKLPDPLELGSAGSFFKNPVVSAEKFESLRSKWPEIPHYDVADGVKIPAAWMIEQCGWKGKSIGGAAVYERQPLIIVNKGGATPGDIVSLASAVRSSVKEKFGVEINPEVNYI